MALIYCPECNKKISDQATVCPGCGVKITTELKQKALKNQGQAILITLVVLVAMFCLCYKCLEPKKYSESEQEQITQDSIRLNEERKKEACTDYQTAIYRARVAVKAILKAPSTAKFNADNAKYVGDCTFEVRGVVDAQNAFGVMLRQRYYAKTSYLPEKDGWIALDAKVEN